MNSAEKINSNLLECPYPLVCFKEIEAPTKAYQDSTTKIDISSLTELQFYNSINDGNLTVSFSTSLQKLTVPNCGWGGWGAPPIAESSTPNVLFTGRSVSLLTLNLSKPSCTFGFELEPNLILPGITATVEFYSGTELVGTIQKTLDYLPNSALFAAKTCCCTPFDRVEISIDEPRFGFAIAQVRYNTDCSSECDCCCSDPTPVVIESCHDSANLPLTITQLNCTGRLLTVDVTVTACQKRSVIVGVIVCDETGEKVLRFKACEACMPEAVTPPGLRCMGCTPALRATAPCVEHTFKFCFVFEKDLCSDLPLTVKTMAEYACFDFPCSC